MHVQRWFTARLLTCNHISTGGLHPTEPGASSALPAMQDGRHDSDVGCAA